jgi:hypothetical protein
MNHEVVCDHCDGGGVDSVFDWEEDLKGRF